MDLSHEQDEHAAKQGDAAKSSPEEQEMEEIEDEVRDEAEAAETKTPAKRAVQEASSSQRRSGRVRRVATNRGSPFLSPDTAKTPRRTAKKAEKEEDEEDSVAEEKGDAEAPSTANGSSATPRSGRGRKSAKADQTPSSSTATASQSKKTKNTPAKAKAEPSSDPFDFDDTVNSHPEPLDNVVVERQAFGDVKFAVVPSPSTGTSKYQKTEQNAKDMLAIKKVETPSRVNASAKTPASRRRQTATPKSRSYVAKPPLKLNNNEDAFESMDFKDSDADVGSTATPKRKRESNPVDSTPLSVKRSRTLDLEPPVLTPEKQVEVDFPEDLLTVPVGGRVYGLWGRVYYPGIVVSYDGGRYNVFFVEDKKYKKLTDNSIIPIRDVRLNVQVDAANEEQNFTVEIKSVPNREVAEDWVKGIFEGFTDEDRKESMSFSWDKISFDTDQAKDIQDQNDSFAKFALGIVVAPSSQARSKRSGVNYDVPRSASPEHTPSRGKASKTATTPRSRPVEKEEPKKLFVGKQFVLTSATRVAGGAAAFNKKEMKRIITEKGGIILEDLMAADENLELYLIADTHYRTFKYLSALALSVPCVSYNWLNACFEKNEFVDREPYMLTSGVDIMSGKSIPWHPNTDLLQGKNICLCGDSETTVNAAPKHFVQIWTPMLEKLGANVLRELPEKDEDIDVVITDGVRSEKIITEAKKRGIPIMSSEWIIQIVIVGKYLPLDGHPKFPFDDADVVKYNPQGRPTA